MKTTIQPEHTLFSADMVATLAKHFGRYQVDGIVTLETNSFGVWIVEYPNDNKVFLGLARPNKTTQISSKQTRH